MGRDESERAHHVLVRMGKGGWAKELVDLVVHF